MAVNAIFKTNNLASIQAERNLYSDLIKEAIQIYGHDVYYVDRTLVARDDVVVWSIVPASSCIEPPVVPVPSSNVI